MRLLYSFVNLPFKMLVLILAYRCHIKGIALPDWLRELVNKSSKEDTKIPDVEAFDSSGKKVK
jgi:hypothetical protein